MSPLFGHPLPAFTLQDDQGTTVTANDFKGHWTVLYAYPKDSTPGCTTEACDFRDNLARVQALGAQVYGISRDSMKSHHTFIAKQSLPFRLLSDPECALLKPLAPLGKRSCTARRWKASSAAPSSSIPRVSFATSGPRST